MDRWEQGLQQLRRYVSIEHSAVVPRKAVGDDGFPVGQWVHQCRVKRRRNTLPESKIAELDRLGFVWRVVDNDQRWLAAAEALDRFSDKHGHRDVPAKHITADGFRLGKWVQSQRAELRRHPAVTDGARYERIRALQLRPSGAAADARWTQGFELLRSYSAEHGDTRVPLWWAADDGFGLGRWVDTQRVAGRRRTLTTKRREALDTLGFEYQTRVSPDTTAQAQRTQLHFEQRLRQLATFRAEHGHSNVPRRYTTPAAPGLGTWVTRQRTLLTRHQLSQQRQHQLSGFGIIAR